MQQEPRIGQPIDVSAIVEGRWVDAPPESKYFDIPVKWAADIPDIPPVTPAPLPLERGKIRGYQNVFKHHGDRFNDELTKIFDIHDPSHIFSQLPQDIIEKIQEAKSEGDKKKIHDTIILCSRFASATEKIDEFNPILDEFIARMKAGALNLDYIPFARSGCTSFVVAFVEHRCNQMAKRTYNLPNLELDETKVQHLLDLRNMMMLDFATPKRDKNRTELLNIFSRKDDEEFIDNMNCSIERTAKLCCTVIDTSVAPREHDIPNRIALALLDDCCEQFLIIITTRDLRQDLKKKTIYRLNGMMKWLFEIATDGVEDEFEKNMKKYYKHMRTKIIAAVQQPPAGGAKSKNKSNKKRNSNKNKNSRRKNKKNKKKTLRLRIKK
jgi:hypothetical protein